MKDINPLIDSIEQHEGYRGEAYKDTLGFDTIGMGTKLPLSMREARLLLRIRLMDMIEHIEVRKPIFNRVPIEVQNILAEMAYQLGVRGLLGFKKMWKHIEEYEFAEASVEGLDSRWAKQTPKRANELMKRMREVEG